MGGSRNTSGCMSYCLGHSLCVDVHVPTVASSPGPVPSFQYCIRKSGRQTALKRHNYGIGPGDKAILVTENINI